MSEVRVMPSTIEDCPTCNGSGTCAYPEPDACYDCQGAGSYFWIDAGDAEQTADIVAHATNQKDGSERR